MSIRNILILLFSLLAIISVVFASKSFLTSWQQKNLLNQAKEQSHSIDLLLASVIHWSKEREIINAALISVKAANQMTLY